MLARRCCSRAVPARPSVQASQQPRIRSVAHSVKPHPLDPSVKVDNFRRHEGDVGSSELQVAALTGRIVHITKHLQANRKDKHSQRGLVILLSKRKRLLKYMFKNDKPAFAKCIRELGIRNPIRGVVISGEKRGKELAAKQLGTQRGTQSSSATSASTAPVSGVPAGATTAPPNAPAAA